MTININYYKHYKGDLYQVLQDNVLHTETNEMLTIYRRVKDNAVFARPSAMFHGYLENGTKRFVEVMPDIKITQGSSDSKILKKGNWSDKAERATQSQNIERHR